MKYLGTSNQLSDVVAELGATKAFIITGRSLYEKTPVIKNIEKALGTAHGGTFSKVGQHAYVWLDYYSITTADAEQPDWRYPGSYDLDEQVRMRRSDIHRWRIAN